jgi:hypothetical protein
MNVMNLLPGLLMNSFMAMKEIIHRDSRDHPGSIPGATTFSE